MLLVIACWFGVRSRRAAIRARGLEGESGRLMRDLGAMQMALVPEVPARLDGLAVSVAYRPAEGPAAGGDFYDVFVPEPGKVAIVLGDICGHGHEALSHAALTHYTLRAYLQAGLEPRAALGLAGEVLSDLNGEHYATVALAVFDAQSSKLTYANAGHPPPIFHGFQAREPLTICSSPPIGWGLPTGRRQTIVALPAGAEVCFFTDGLIDARSEGRVLGRERLNEILGELGPRPVASDLLELVRAEAQATPDDMAACILLPDTVASDRCTHLEELEVDSRALSGSGVWRFLDACRVPSAEIAQTLQLALEIATKFDTALLKVELEQTSATVIATGPGPGAVSSDAQDDHPARVSRLA